ncbi:transcriptional repressor [Candidatus Kaiserbacteria bacterium]|nr:transcriptional repressor [Candidatus Kaiserbacteria bacterium]
MKIRLTKKRQEILNVLKKHHGTLSAKAIHEQLLDIDLATVYRSLDLFVKEGLIAQVPLGGDETQYEYQVRPHHHAVCTDCSKVIHFEVPDKDIKKLLGLKDFDIEKIEMTVKGSCGH